MFFHWSGNAFTLTGGYYFTASDGVNPLSNPDSGTGRLFYLKDGVVTFLANFPNSFLRSEWGNNNLIFTDGGGSGTLFGTYQINEALISSTTTPGSQPSMPVNDIDGSSDLSYVSIALNNQFTGEIPMVVYARSGTIYTRQTLSMIPVGSGTDYSDYAPDSTATNSDGTVFIWVGTFGSTVVLKRSGSTFSLITQSIGIAQSCSWSPAGNYLVVYRNRSGSPLVADYLSAYSWNSSTETFSGISIPSLTDTPGLGLGLVIWSKTGNYLAVSYPESPYVAIYKFNGSSFTKLSDPFDQAPNASVVSTGISWSSDDNYVFIGTELYSRTGDSFTKITDDYGLTGPVRYLNFQK
jgi:hypothetical protein